MLSLIISRLLGCVGDEEAVEVVPGLPGLAMEMVALHAEIDKQVRNGQRFIRSNELLLHEREMNIPTY